MGFPFWRSLEKLIEPFLVAATGRSPASHDVAAPRNNRTLVSQLEVEEKRGKGDEETDYRDEKGGESMRDTSL